MTTYWLSDFCALINSFNIIPFNNKDKNEDFNALTRLIILATVILYIKHKDTEILLGGLISVISTVIIYLLFTKSSFDTYLVKPSVVSKSNPITRKEQPVAVEDRVNKDVHNISVTNSTFEKGLNSKFSPKELF